MHERLEVTFVRLLLTFGSSSSSSPDAASSADVIYFGGPIITVDDAQQPNAEAVAVKDG